MTEMKPCECKSTAYAVGVSEATLFRRMKNPETFTLEELHRIIKVLRIPKEEISDFVFS